MREYCGGYISVPARFTLNIFMLSMLKDKLVNFVCMHVHDCTVLSPLYMLCNVSSWAL